MYKTTSFNLDITLHERFKLLCHIRGEKIGKAIIKLITDELENAREEIIEYEVKEELKGRIDEMTVEQVKEVKKKWR